VSAVLRLLLLFTLLVLAGPGAAQAPVEPDGQAPASLGALLYSTHCVACHTNQMHWRNNRQATDWASLKSQVRSWQGRANLQWTDADINEVARHLNETIYHYPLTADQVGLLGLRQGGPGALR
jgi:mono/diheme cytochrome c family protein